ncbi:MAG: efflux transporter outer membrane subunit [Betaproteobacteria bacterium]|nr:efflux transporter outer membrane subunit [Betaproteobacteria bacterium]
MRSSDITGVLRRVIPLGLAVLAGCSFVPPLERPTPPVAAQWPEGANPAGARAVAGLAWQQFLPDARLQALVTAALENNRDLRIAVARVAEAQALYGIVKADRLPTINAAAGGTAARTPADLSATGAEAINRRYDVAFTMTSFELDFWGRVRSLDEAALANYLATDEARESFRLSLIADVANAYFTLQEMQERLVLARAAVQSRAENRMLVERRRDAGLANDLDFLAADGAYEAARADAASLERNRAAAANALTLLVGTVPANLPQPRRLTQRDIVPDLAVDVPSETLLQRPDVRAAEQRLVAANATIGAARAAFLPRVGISLSAGTASGSLSGLFDSGSGAWSFVPSLVVPIFDAGRNQSTLDLAQVRKVIAVADYERTIQQAFREVADLLSARDALAEQIRAQEAAERSQNQRLLVAEARYKAGVSNYIEVLDAQRDSYIVSQLTVMARRLQLTTAVQLYKALGGGQEAQAPGRS